MIETKPLLTRPDCGGIAWWQYTRAFLSWPLTDRSFVLHLPLSKEVDWYGKKALFLLIKEGSHHAKLEGQDSLIRVTNSGNFYVVSPDKAQPEAGCKVFGLTNNLCNGWIPKKHFFVPRSLLLYLFTKLKTYHLSYFYLQTLSSLLTVSSNTATLALEKKQMRSLTLIIPVYAFLLMSIFWSSNQIFFMFIDFYLYVVI